MLYNSDGLPVIFMVYQKGYIFKCDCWYILPVFPILHTFKKKKSVLLRKKNKIWFSKSIFPKGTSGKRGVVLYSGQYDISIDTILLTM